MAYKSRVSDAVVRRLPMYYRHLRELEKAGVVRISSQELGERMNLTASQIRQDINCFGGFGQQGYGYHVANLKERIGEILGLNHEYHVIIIGAGRAGRALAPMLEKQGVRVKVIDKDPERCRLMADKLVNGIAICGDGTDIDLLTEEGVAEADVVVCLTEDDKLNLMLALLARHMSHNKTKTVVRVARNEYVELMEKVGVDIVLSARLLSASEVLAFARRGGVVSVSLLLQDGHAVFQGQVMR